MQKGSCQCLLLGTFSLVFMGDSEFFAVKGQETWLAFPQESGSRLHAERIAHISGLVFVSFDFGENLAAYCSAMQ